MSRDVKRGRARELARPKINTEGELDVVDSDLTGSRIGVHIQGHLWRTIIRPDRPLDRS